MPRRYADPAARRARDREIQRLAANRRVGHDHAYLILYGAPIIKALAPLVAVAAGCAWLWFEVDHRLLATAAIVAGGAMLVLYTASTIGATGPQARQMARATGRRTRPVWWHGVGLAGLLLLGFAYEVMPR